MSAERFRSQLLGLPNVTLFEVAQIAVARSHGLTAFSTMHNNQAFRAVAPQQANDKKRYFSNSVKRELVAIILLQGFTPFDLHFHHLLDMVISFFHTEVCARVLHYTLIDCQMTFLRNTGWRSAVSLGTAAPIAMQSINELQITHPHGCGVRLLLLHFLLGRESPQSFVQLTDEAFWQKVHLHEAAAFNLVSQDILETRRAGSSRPEGDCQSGAVSSRSAHEELQAGCGSAISFNEPRSSTSLTKPDPASRPCGETGISCHYKPICR